MPPLFSTALLLLGALGVSAQSPSTVASSASTASTAASTATGVASAGNETAPATVPQNITVLGEVGAQANGTETPNNATLQSVWSTETSRGTLSQGLTLLQNSSGTAANQSVVGVFVYYDEETAVRNANSSVTTEIPWIAYISCDEPTQAVSVPVNEVNSTISAFGNVTAALPVNATASNGTAVGAASPQANITEGLFAQAEAQGAKGVLLYSAAQQSCSLNLTAHNSTNTSLPVFTTPSRNVANLVNGQFQNVAEEYRYFNASLLNNAAANLSSIVGANAGSNLTAFVLSRPSYYVLARLVPSYAVNDSSNGVVATIGRAPPRSATASVAPGPTNSGGAGTSGASPRPQRSRTALALTGFLVGGLVAAVGVLI
ncbi:hypothetical protein JCM3770_003632 [Rhodotorula araucariae]